MAEQKQKELKEIRNKLKKLLVSSLSLENIKPEDFKPIILPECIIDNYEEMDDINE